MGSCKRRLFYSGWWSRIQGLLVRLDEDWGCQWHKKIQLKLSNQRFIAFSCFKRAVSRRLFGLD